MAFSMATELLLGDVDASHVETEGSKTSKGMGWVTASCCRSRDPHLCLGLHCARGCPWSALLQMHHVTLAGEPAEAG